MTDPARRAFLKSAALGALAAGSGLRPAWAGEDAQLRAVAGYLESLK